MASVDTVTIESSPAPVDESLRRILVPSKGGGLETLYQCENCSETFSTTASHKSQVAAYKAFSMRTLPTAICFQGKPCDTQKKTHRGKTIWMYSL